MRHVHDFDLPDVQVACGSDAPYSSAGAEPPKWEGCRVDLVICNNRQPVDGQPFLDGDCIHWEGRLEVIQDALKQALSALEMVERHAREQKAVEIENSVVCGGCGRWNDKRREWHGDGKGNRCEWVKR